MARLRAAEDAQADVSAAISLVIEAQKAGRTPNLEEAKSLLTEAKNLRSAAFDNASAAEVAAQTNAADAAAAIAALASAEGLLVTALGDPADAAKVDAALRELERCRTLLDTVSEPAETDPRPNVLDLLHADTRTIITLSSGLLGVSATFAANLLGDAGGLSKLAMVIAWVLLAVSIILAIYASGKIVAVAAGGKTQHPINNLYAAFIAMVLGVGLLGAAVVATWADDDAPGTVQELVDQAKEDIRVLADDVNLQLVATSFEQGADVTTVVLTDAAARSWTVRMEDGKATAVSQN